MPKKKGLLNEESKSKTTKTPIKREEVIERYHEVRKQLAAAVAQGNSTKQAELQTELDDHLGGINAYQAASQLGTKTRGTYGKFASHNWVTRTLLSLHLIAAAGTTTTTTTTTTNSNHSTSVVLSSRHHGDQQQNDDDEGEESTTTTKKKRRARLLDVGSLHNHYADDPRLRRLFKSTAIDLNAQDASVVQCDLLSMVPAEEARKRFDVVVMSLVVNFEGDARRRGLMLLRARDLSVPGSGLVCVTLPRACFENSRYMTHELFCEMATTALGLDVLHVTHTTRLTLYVLRNLGLVPFNKLLPLTPPPVDLTSSTDNKAVKESDHEEEEECRFPKRLVAPGPNRNNFTIIL